MKARNPGEYTLIFDNSFSRSVFYLRSRHCGWLSEHSPVWLRSVSSRRFISKKVLYKLSMEQTVVYDGSDWPWKQGSTRHTHFCLSGWRDSRCTSGPKSYRAFCVFRTVYFLSENPASCREHNTLLIGHVIISSESASQGITEISFFFFSWYVDCLHRTVSF